MEVLGAERVRLAGEYLIDEVAMSAFHATGWTLRLRYPSERSSMAIAVGPEGVESVELTRSAKRTLRVVGVGSLVKENSGGIP